MSDNLDNADFCKKKILISKILALILGGAAIYMLCGVWGPVITTHHFDSPSDFIFLFIFPIPCTVLAIYFLHAASILRCGISSRGIRKLSVCLSLIFAYLLLIIISGIEESFSEKKEFFGTYVPTSVIMIVAGLFYLQLKRGLFKCFSVVEVVDYATHRGATKLYFGFLGLSIWSDITGATELLPKDPNFEYLPANRWLGGLITLGSIPLAFCCYRIGLKLFLKKLPNVRNVDEATTEILDAGSSLP